MSDAPNRLTAALSDRYTIERELGAGGMATVYLAHDLKHERQVAIKVLKPELAAVLGAERFVQEIKTTAALSHPHILPLFDSGSADRQLYYVMPYIQGETIRDKLNRETQFGIDEAVKITTEVADALDYAHRHGVIHRDIKPENILLHDGRPMVMDFGIALAVSAAAGGRMTETGLSLGTPHYMSPEQATADKEITGRSDIYSLGSVLYEMLTGDPPHTGSSAQQVIMKIVTENAPPVTKLRKSVPPNVASAVSNALEKLPADRFATAREFAEALANPGFTTAGLAAATTPPNMRAFGWWIRSPWSWLALAALAAAFRGIAVRLPSRAANASLTTMFAIAPPPGSGADQMFGDATVSPDGETIAFISTSGDTTQLYIRRLGDMVVNPVPESRGASNPFFSPDSKWLAFVADGKLHKVPLDGGRTAVVSFPESTNGWAPGGTWTTDGTILLASGVTRTSFNQFTADGRMSSATFKTVNPHALPLALPDGDGVVFIVWGPGFTEDDSLAVGSMRAGEWHTLGIIAVQPLGFIDGQLVYLTADGSVMAVPFNPRTRRVTGTAVRIDDGIAPNGIDGALGALSPKGTLVIQRGSMRSRLVMLDASGVHAVSSEQSGFTNPSRSPDGRRIATAILEPSEDATGSDIWIFDSIGQPPRRLTDTGTYWGPVWMPDSKRIVYRSLYQKKPEIMLQPADGSAPATRIFQGSDDTYIQDVSVTPGGTGVIFTAVVVATGATALYYLPVAGAKPETLTLPTERAAQGRVSPDGRWLTYTLTDEAGSHVVVQRFRAAGGRLQLSTGMATDPKWVSATAVTYISGDGHLNRVTLRPTHDGLEVATRQPIYPGVLFPPLPSYDYSSLYDLAPDGRLLMVQRTSPRNQLVVTTNWDARLRARIAARR